LNIVTPRATESVALVFLESELWNFREVYSRLVLRYINSIAFISG
jgi:hypothetical protein